MSKPKLGPWMPASVNPVHEGVYKVRTHFGAIRYARWNRHDRFGYWGPPFSKKQDAANRIVQGYFQSLRWRGLAEKPNA